MEGGQCSGRCSKGAHQYHREVLHDQTDFLHLDRVPVRVFISGWGEGEGVDGGRDVWTYKGRHEKAVFFAFCPKNG